MRRYTVTINGSDHVIDVEEVTADTFTVRMAGRVLDVRLTDQTDLAQAVITPQVVPAAPGIGPAVRPPQTSAGLPAKPTPRPAAHVLTAPMPGVVVSVATGAGAAVTRGQTLLVLEAMKMKNDLRSPRDAVVARVLVAEGDQVRHGDPLVEFGTGGT